MWKYFQFLFDTSVKQQQHQKCERENVSCHVNRPHTGVGGATGCKHRLRSEGSLSVWLHSRGLASRRYYTGVSKHAQLAHEAWNARCDAISTHFSCAFCSPSSRCCTCSVSSRPPQWTWRTGARTSRGYPAVAAMTPAAFSGKSPDSQATETGKGRTGSLHC